MLNPRAVQALKIVALIASSNPCQAVNSKQLSLELGLSISYIENLLKNLKKNELVVANRGPGGGYLLQKMLLDLMQLLAQGLTAGEFTRTDFSARFVFWLKATDNVPHRNFIHTFL